ncbi:MAG TPA: hypothetical protein VK171_02085 [Fimbriimonas sp.]|nr:hypothetical protein [Fimbriimonas sp.]
MTVLLPRSILFVGNSHTQANDLPLMVKKMFGTTPLTYKVVGGSFLNDIAKGGGATRELKAGKYDAVVLQGAMLSSSHKYKYSQAGAIELANLAKSLGTKPFLFAEWSRRGWKETEYILGIYGEISKETGATIIPVCKSFDRHLAQHPNAAMWAPDGNHASEQGSYLAALTIYRKLGGREAPAWKPQKLSQADADALWKATTY